MTTTSQTNTAEETPDLSSDKVETAQEPQTVPLTALQEQRQKTRDALAKIKELEAALAQPKQPEKPAATESAPRGDETLRKTVEDLTRRERVRELTTELGLSNSKQADAVLKILASNDGLSPIEALDVAAKRDAELFKDRGRAGFDSSTHASLAPTRGSQPESRNTAEQDREARAKAVDSAPTTKRKAALINNMVGSHVAKALGWEHRLTDI